MPTREHFITNAPRIYAHKPGDATYDSLSVPSAQLYPSRRPSWILYELIKIIVGPYERGVVIVPTSPTTDAAFLLGITAPATAPVLASAGGGTLVGDMIGFIAYVHQVDGVDIHESDLSPGSNTLTLTGTQQRSWVWDDSDAEPRVNFVRLYVSVDGDIPKFVADVPIGVGIYTENVSDPGFSPPVDADGNLLNERGVPPTPVRIVAKWRRRAIYGPDPDFPHRYWYSMNDEPESVGPLNYIDLHDRESIVSLADVGNYLLAQSSHSTYVQVGYDEFDFQLEKISSDFGCLSHFASVLIGEERWFPAQAGMCAYPPGGTIRLLLGHDVQVKWTQDYKATPSIFENSIAINDTEDWVYLLLLSYPTQPLSRFWVGHYIDETAAMGRRGPMRWTFDYEGRGISGLGYLFDIGSMRKQLYSASCDGYVRQRNDYENDDDDGDVYQKLVTIERPHYLPKRGKGTNLDGNKLEVLTVYLQSEEKDWSVEIRAGDVNAYLAARPTKSYRMRASRRVRAGRTLTPKADHPLHPQVTGKGWIFKYLIPRARGIVYSGEGIQWSAGSNARART